LQNISVVPQNLIAGTSLSITTVSNGPSVSSVSAGPTVFNVVDNQNYTYFAQLGITLPTAASLDLRFYGLRISYTLPGPAN